MIKKQPMLPPQPRKGSEYHILLLPTQHLGCLDAHGKQGGIMETTRMPTRA